MSISRLRRDDRLSRCRGVAGAAGALGAALAISLATPLGAMADPAPQSVTGSGTVAATQFSVAVAGGPFGQNPSGSLTLQGFFNFTATPTCMNIADGAGVVGFQIDNGPMAGQGFLAASELDQSGRTVQYSAVLTAPPTACPPDDAPAPPNAIENGGGGTVFSGQLTDTGGPQSPLPLSEHRFPVSGAPTGARAIAQAQDGTVWFIEPSANRLVAVSNDASGALREYDVPTADAGLSSIAPDVAPCTSDSCTNGMWFTESDANQIGRVNANGTMSEHSLPTAGAQASSISGDPAGGAWFTEPGVDRVGRITASGTTVEYRLPTRGANPVAIATASNGGPSAAGGAWFAEKTAKQIGFIDGNGRISEYALPAGAGAPTAIVADAGAGATGAWFLEPSANAIGHIDAAGDINQYWIPTVGASPQGLASGAGPDGTTQGAWFSESSSGELGFVSTAGQFSEFTIPGAQPGAVAFAPSIDVPPIDGYSSYEALWWADPAARNVGVATFPLNVRSGAPLVPPPPLPSYVKISLARKVTVRGGRIKVPLRCEGATGQCRGLVSVAIATARTARVTAPFATTRFSIRPNHRQTLVLKVNRSGIRLLRRHRQGLPVSVNVSGRGRVTASTRTATLRLG